MANASFNSCCSFTELELKEKEKSLLELMKKTLVEYRKSWLKRTEKSVRNLGNYIYYDVPRSIDRLKFKTGQIHVKLISMNEGMIVVWGRFGKSSQKNLKISFKLDDSPNLSIKFDSFLFYPFEENFLIKDILYRMNINNEDDFNHLLSGFKNLLISYI